MTKELFVSSSPHETKVAVLEDDQLVEVYFERESSVGLVGAIYKGRVNRVLPGMQSAFVNIGLERDAFLYVSDFVEDEEEYDKIFTDAETRATKFVESAGTAAIAPPLAPAPAPAASETAEVLPAETVAVPAQSEPTPPEAATAPAPPASGETPARGPEPSDFRRREFRGRGRFRRGRGRDFRHGQRHDFQQPPSRPAEESTSEEHGLTPLPGESLAKYREMSAPQEESPGAATTEPAADIAAAPEATTGEAAVAETPAPESTAPASVEAARQTAAAEKAPEPPAPQSATVAEADLEPRPEVVEAESTVIFTPMTVFGQAPEQPAESLANVPAPQEPAPAASQAPAEPAGETEAPVGAAAEAFPEAEEAIEGDATAEGEEIEEPATEGAAAEAAPEGAPATAAPATEGAAEGDEKKFTLREPQGRPRFAPRRRRGRRGGMGRRERSESPRSNNQPPVQISDVLKEGQEIIVQIAKEPLGTKGARITSHVALPGRYLVYMPTISHIGVSRKIGSEEERLRLRNIILENRGSLTGGFIVRTAGAGRSEEEFKTDLRFLSTLWNDIKSKAERVKAPALLHRDLNLVQRILRDILSPDFKQIRVDNEADYERCVEFVNQSQPSLVGHVKLYTRKTPMFEEFGIQQEIDQALKPKVWLKSGGYIVINQTEALVAIDVNTGKYVGKTNRLEDTILKTNIDAINEIVRQVRLRDLGGIIVIDFIDMDERKNRHKVVQALEEALRRDRAPTKVISFNDFGLVAVTRKRVKQSLERTLCQPCSYCSGAGWVKSVTTVCYEILSEVKKMADDIEGETMTLRVHPDVAQALKSKQGALLSEIEALTHKDVFIKGDPSVHIERFEIY
jgi:ribonuclease G